MLNAIDRLSFVMALASGLALLIIAVLIAAEIILRKSFGISMHFLWEIASFIQLTAVFLGAGWTLRTGGHIRVTIISSKAPRLFEWLATLFGLAISAYLTRALILMAWGYFKTDRTTGSITDTPLVYPAALVALGAAMLTLQLVLRVLRLATGEVTETDQTGASNDALALE